MTVVKRVSYRSTKLYLFGSSFTFSRRNLSGYELPLTPQPASHRRRRAISSRLSLFDLTKQFELTTTVHEMTLKKIDHEFKNKSLSYDAEPNYQPCIKLSFWFNKLPEVSYEQFHRHWETVHADLTVATKEFDGLQDTKICAVSPEP